jgi:hypothetical protein
MIAKFITYKEPHKVTGENGEETGIMFRSHVLMSDGRHLAISDAQHGVGLYRIDETLVFPCNESGEITNWTEVAGGREMRTDEVVKNLNEDYLNEN